MRILCSVFLLVVVAVCVAQAQAPESNPAKAAKTLPGFDVNDIDRAVDPCTNFYRFACGKWLEKNPVPAEYPSWGRFDELYERNIGVLKQILEKAAADRDSSTNHVAKKIGTYYAACMDEKRVEQLGSQPLKADLDRIAALRNKAELPTLIAGLHNQGLNVLFGFTSDQDFKNAEQVIASADQGGLGLPDRDYYLKTDAESERIRKEYVAHVQKMLELLGEKPAAAAEQAKSIMAMETELAKASQDRTFRRNPANIYHKMETAKFVKLTPAFSWEQYIAAIRAPQFQEVNVVSPDFLTGMDALIKAHPLDHLKSYLRWHVVRMEAPYLSTPFVQEDFNFDGKILEGRKELRPRWKRCVDYTDRDLGDALGQFYVEQTFGTEGKQRTLEMVQALEKALEADIRDLPWMSEGTKPRAQEKLHNIANKIGYPDKWRDYSSIEVKPDDLVGNVARSQDFEFHRQLNKIGKPVDRKEWLMSPPTVNAYYSPQMNDINFPAGILQPPFYDNKLDDAVNYGGIGAVIGHELTHGFDDQGRKFDAKGNMNDWWTAEDGKEFEQRASCVADEYSQFVAVKGSEAKDNLKLNGRLTLGENTADNGGVRIAYMALVDTLKQRGENATEAKIDGFMPQQRFFLGWGQIWCENRTPEYARMLVTVDPHSPGETRVNGVMVNMPEFQQAFACKKDAPMVRENACRVW
jgi:putative endopeptidase